MNVSVEEVFAASRLDNPSSAQIGYANHVLEGIRCAIAHGGGDVMIEAETGVGKTLGYLIPAALEAIRHNGRVIVATYTRSLQRQVVEDAEKMLQGIEAATGRRLSVARLVGKRNFFDIDRVLKYHAEVDEGDSSADAWDDLVAWLKSPGSSGEIQDYLDEAGALPGGIDPSLVCLDSMSSMQAQAPYEAHRQAAFGADILITNHALLCLASMHNQSIVHDNGDQRPVVAVVIDEADQLPNAARDMVSDMAPLVSMRSIAEHIELVIGLNDNKPITSAINAMLAYCDKVYPSLGERTILLDKLSDNTRNELGRLAKEIIGAIDQSRNDLDRLDEKGLKEKVADLIGYRNVLYRVFALDNNKSATAHVLSFSPKRGYPSIAVTRLYPARIVRNLLDYLRAGATGEKDDRPSFGTALVLTSATLSISSSRPESRFIEMQKQFGIFDRENPCSHLHTSFSPKSFGKIEKIVLADPSIHKPFEGSVEDHEPYQDGIFVQDEIAKVSDEWVDYAASMIAKAVGEGGYVLALTTSYRVSALIEISLRGKGVTNVVSKLRKDHLDTSVERLKSIGGGVLLAPSGWEGLDSRRYGFSWQSVVICQIPLVRTDNAYKKAIYDYLRSKGKTDGEASAIVYGEIVSAAFRKMKQGIGRGIRKADDAMSLWVADPRLPPWGSALESDDPLPRPNPANRQMPIFMRAIPSRFADVPTKVLLKSGAMVE